MGPKSYYGQPPQRVTKPSLSGSSSSSAKARAVKQPEWAVDIDRGSDYNYSDEVDPPQATTSQVDTKLWNAVVKADEAAVAKKKINSDNDAIDAKHAVRFEKMFCVSNNDATTLTMLFRMSEMRVSLSKLLNPNELAHYAGLLSGLCGTIALLESKNQGLVNTYVPSEFTFKGLTTNSIVAELGYRMQDFGNAVYHNAANLLNRQLMDTFGVWEEGFTDHIENHVKTDTNTTWDIFKLNSGQFGVLCASYCNEKSVAGDYIRRCWTRMYVYEKEMTNACKDIASRMRPDHVAHMALLCGAMSDLIELLVGLELKIRAKSKTAVVYDANDVRAAARAYKCMLAAKEKFKKIPGENERLMVGSLCSIAMSVRNYIIAKYYQAAGDAKTALYFISRMQPTTWFVDDQHTILNTAATVTNSKNILSQVSAGEHPEVYRLDFPDDDIPVSSRFYEVVRDLDIQWPFFHLSLTQQAMLTPTTLADAMKPSSSVTAAAK